MYYLLTESFKEQQQQVVDVIVKMGAVEKIYFLGSTLVTRRTESIFMPDAPGCSKVEYYYFLIIIGNERDHNEVQDKIENACLKIIPVTAVVLSEERFTSWLLEGHAFAYTVYLKAVLLHGEKDALPLAVATKDAVTLQKEINAIYTAGLNRVEAFLAGADLYRIREQNKMGAFMLHQAAEQALHTLLEIKTGLRVVTHNLDKLYRYCCMGCYQLPEILFVSNKENDKRFFSLLQKAYIDARYKPDYFISSTDLVAFMDIVRRLKAVLQ